MEGRQPGHEFLLRRLARAEAVPPAERSPEVAAFVESVHLLQEACQLLPLTSDGQPALQPGTPATLQQVQLAFLKYARASYLCPPSTPLAADVQLGRHVSAYLPFAGRISFGGYTFCVGLGSTSAGAGASIGSSAPLLQVLATHLLSEYSARAGPDGTSRFCSLQLWSEAAAKLADPATQQLLTRLLPQVSEAAGLAEPLLSLPQLQHAMRRGIVDACGGLLVADASLPSG